ncbi:MFS transporter [Cytobacillus sp. Sa5YUA1]|uniref:MFS transporter n=1 Tax=Cytobacillus stercorigallinarum TaxID=2762240 RepID=A0ABR8QLP2_9BACI|nr:MFS transporter [Cytobacillus stercorigallinarum]MBD7936435.1 MFS transporter [Cytobacillus stercorigallinarum]
MNKSFYYLWASISFGKLSLSLYTMTATLIIFSLTHSATLAAMVMLIHVIGKFLSGFVFPLVTESTSLKKILSMSQLTQFLIIACILGVVSMDINQVVQLTFIYSLIGLAAFMDGFISPSRMSLIPELVEDTKIGKANSLISTTDQSFALLGWSVGTIAINYYGESRVLLVSLTLLMLSFFSSLRLKIKKIKEAKKLPKWEIIKAGWFILFSKKNHMRTITTMDILEGIASGIWIGGITLVFVIEVLNKGEQWWGFINTSYYVGSILGGILITIFSRKLQKHLIKGIIVSSFLVSMLIFFYAANSTAWIALVLVVIMGPFYQLRDISQQTYIQKVTLDDSLSKLYAAKDNLYYLVFALSVFITGLISDYMGVVYVYFLAFLLYLISSIFALITFRKGNQSPQIDKVINEYQ